MLSQHNKNTHAFHIPSNSCYTHDTQELFSPFIFASATHTHTHAHTRLCGWPSRYPSCTSGALKLDANRGGGFIQITSTLGFVTGGR